MVVSHRQSAWGSIAACVGLAATGAFAQISAVLPAGSITLKSVHGLAKFDGGSIAGPSGSPALPKYTLTFLLPANTDPKSVSVALEGSSEESVSGSYDVAPVPAISANGTVSWPAGSNIVAGRDLNVYGKNAYYPASFVGEKRFGKLGEFQLLEVDIREYLYNPSTRTLRHVLSGNVVVRSSLSKVATASVVGSTGLGERLSSQVQSMVANYPTAIGTYKNVKAAASTTAATTTYMIVTTSDILSASTKLGAFADAKIAAGFNVEIATATALMRRSAGAWVCQNATVCDGGWGGGSGDAAAEKLRSWLKANYASRNIEYALLVGNPDPATGTLPMKMMWPRYNETIYRESPSDIYYADLTGNWDLNGDGIYGQEGVDDGIGGLDKYCEINVGRIPYYGSVADLDKILAKTIRYQNETDNSWRANVLLPMRIMWDTTQNYFLGEWVKSKVLDPLGWASYRIYDKDYGVSPNATPTTETNVLSAWKNNAFGMHIFLTHGWAQGASDIFTSPNATQLDDNHPSFVIQTTCSNAEPEYSDNMAYSLLLNGAIGTLGATRVSWLWGYQDDFSGNDGSLPTIGYKFSQYMVRDTMTFGKALTRFRATTDGWLMNLEDFNIYGDPSLSLGRPTPKAPTSGLRVLYRNGDASAADNQIKPYFQVVNTGTKTESLAGVKIRYWFTNDNTASLQTNCDWCQIGATNLGLSTGSLVPSVASADRYMDVVFAGTAGSLAPGASSGELQTRLNHMDWTNFNEAGDYSYNAARTTYGSNDKVGLYSSAGRLIAGTEPGISTPTPEAPAIVSAVAGDASAKITWKKVATAISYTLKFSKAPGDTLAVAGLVDTVYNKTDLVNGTTYAVVVSASNAAGEGANSSAASVTPAGLSVPAAPTGLKAVASDKRVQLSWNSATGAMEYVVERSDASTPYAVVATVSIVAYVDLAVANGTTYSYRVRAKNAAGTGTPSSVVTAKPEGSLEPCSPATDMSGGQSGNFNTTGSVCKRTTSTIAGWGCSNFTGRTVKVNGIAVACGGALPAKTASGHYYFDVSAGSVSWASLYWW